MSGNKTSKRRYQRVEKNWYQSKANTEKDWRNVSNSSYKDMLTNQSSEQKSNVSNTTPLKNVRILQNKSRQNINTPKKDNIISSSPEDSNSLNVNQFDMFEPKERKIINIFDCKNFTNCTNNSTYRKKPINDIPQTYIRNFKLDLKVVQDTSEINKKIIQGLGTKKSAYVESSFDLRTDSSGEVNMITSVYYIVISTPISFMRETDLLFDPTYDCLQKQSQNLPTIRLYGSGFSDFARIRCFNRTKKMREYLRHYYNINKSEDIKDVISNGKILKDTVQNKEYIVSIQKIEAERNSMLLVTEKTIPKSSLYFGLKPKELQGMEIQLHHVNVDLYYLYASIYPFLDGKHLLKRTNYDEFIHGHYIHYIDEYAIENFKYLYILH